MATPNRFELEQWGRQAARAYLDDGVPLNTTIAKVASAEGFTPHHVERVVQSANQFVNGLIVKEAKMKGEEPRLSFDRADRDSVLSMVKEASTGHIDSMSKRASREDNLFRLPSRGAMEKVASADALGGMFSEEELRDPYTDRRGPAADGLGHAFLFNREAAVNMSKIASYRDIRDAVDDLEGVLRKARTDAALLKDVGSVGLDKLADLVDHELLNKAHPDFIKKWAESAKLAEDTKKAICDMVDDRLEVLALTFPKEAAALPDGFIVNRDHPLMKVAADLEQVAKNQFAQSELISRIEDAVSAAKKSLRDAALEQAG